MIRLAAAILSAFLAITAFALPAAAQSRALTIDEEFLLQEISRHNTAIRTIAGTFLQVDGNGRQIEGTFFLKRPNMVRFRYGPPSREEIISQGRGFYVIDREARTQYAYSQDHVPLRQFLGNEVNLITTNLSDVVVSETHVSVSVTDQSPIGTVQASLIFDRNSLDLVQWSLIEPSGAEITFAILETEQNVEIPDHYFYIDPTYRAVNAPN